MSKRQKREEEEVESDEEENEFQDDSEDLDNEEDNSDDSEENEEDAEQSALAEELDKRLKQMNKGRKGECKICSKAIPKTSAAEHVAKCLQESSSNSEDARKYYLFKVESLGYFLYVAVRPETSLKVMDEWIREVWLECCGHLSSFTISTPKKKTKSSNIFDIFALADREQRFISSLSPHFSDPDEKDMQFPIKDIAKVGLVMEHTYDFGTPTISRWTLVSEGKASFDEPYQVLAQNKATIFPCVGKKNTCTNPATQIKTYGVPITWCEECFEKSKQDEEEYLPVVNSPRVGQCGFTG